MTKTERSAASLALAALCLIVRPAAVEAEGERGAEREGAVVVVAAPRGAKPVTARCDAAGAIHLLYDSAAGPQYARSDDGGRSFAPAIPVVDADSRKPGLEFNGWDLAVGAGGRVHVALGSNAWKLKLPKEAWGLYYARLDRGARAFSPVRNISGKPCEGYSLAADERGNVTACWLSDKLYANISHDHGESFAPYVEIDASLDPCNCCTTSCCYAADGRLAVLYREETDDRRDMYLVLWDQRRHETTRKRVSGAPWRIDSCPMTYYSIAAAPGGFVAAWPTRGEIYFARLDRAGQPLSPADIKTPGACGIRTGVLALTNSEGDALVAWKKDGRLGWQVYDARGRPSGAAGSVESSGKGAAGVVSKDGRFVLVR